MKIIFLDFDGVLCNPESISAGYKARTAPEQDPYGPHADCVAALNGIIRETGATIVVSSTWRKVKNAHTSMAGLLKRWGVEGTVIGVTPELRGDGYSYRRRGSEIQQWLSQYSRPVESFVILDDDSDMNGLKERLVQTNFVRGLTVDDANQAIQMLNTPIGQYPHGRF